MYKEQIKPIPVTFFKGTVLLEEAQYLPQIARDCSTSLVISTPRNLSGC